MVMLSLVLVSTWANMGGATILYLAGLAAIPGDLYEAAELDGAGVWRRIWHVTLPQMRFLLIVLLLLQIIATMQVFIEPYQLTGTTDPNTITIIVLIYRYAFAVNQDLRLFPSTTSSGGQVGQNELDVSLSLAWCCLTSAFESAA